MIAVTCHQCGTQLHVEDRYAGGTWTCGQCQAQVQVPARAPEGILPPPPVGAASSATETSGKAIASLVLGLLSVFGSCSVFTGVPGIILGHMAQSEISQRRGELGGSGLAIAGLVFSYVGTLLFVVILFVGMLTFNHLPGFSNVREAALRASCQNNLKQMGLVFKMYANESRREHWPTLSSEPGRLMMPAIEIYDEYLVDATILICPSHPHTGELHQISDPLDMIDDHSYFYLGYVVTNEAEVEAFAEAYRERIAEGLPFDENLDVTPGTGSNGGDQLLRLREGVERLFGEEGARLEDIWRLQSRIPVLIEPPGHHTPPGGNVLYMDGHVEFIRLGEKWPMTEPTIDTLKDLAGR